MNRTHYCVIGLTVILASASPGQTNQGASNQASGAKPPAGAESQRAGRTDAGVPEAPLEAKVVAYAEKDVVEIKTKLRYSTLLVLPKKEQILDFTCGDKDLWVINGTQNFAHIKPAKLGARTNLNLVTASGNVYSFVLTEV